MTRRTSDVAVCCSNDSDSSLASRAALASSPAADEPRGRAVPVPLGRFDAAGLRRRGLAEPALERPFIAFPEAQEAHRSGSDLGAESVGSKAESEIAALQLVSDFTLHPPESAILPTQATGLWVMIYRRRCMICRRH